MNKRDRTYQNLFFIIVLAWILALTYSMEFVLSLSMIGTIIIALISLYDTHTTKETVVKFLKNKAWLAIMIPFFLIITTAIYSTEDSAYLLERLRIKLPYLVLPFAFYSIPKLDSKTYRNIFYAFIFIMTVASIQVLVHYFMDYKHINNLIAKGQAIPTPTNHIRFSLMLALAILLGFSLFRKQHYIKFKWEKWLILGITLFLLAFIHLLSVRSGLAVFYLAFMTLLVRHIIINKQYIRGFLIGLGMLLFPIAAYYSFPSLQNKISYMKWDLKMQKDGDGNPYSDSERIQSLLAAKNIIEQHPIVGVGAGDLKQQMHEQYKRNYPKLPKQSYKMPHNQFISIWAGTGIIGLILFFLGGAYPLLSRKRYLEPHFLAISLIILFSFLVENTIETAIGIGFHLLFLLLGMNYLKTNDEIVSKEKIVEK